ncbi:MAG TPA: pyridoxal 5'-phosphate synthase glutaminase subunit PdxT [Candidatus Krumholzibacteria bacterium]|nr:pyridoxal 5'-phosphate synthase glutaminase subunit PdxT [Candidatus Krumholzibacteria bacterium]HPD72222.1 pyridoxal 5'-phosphate synthase glutaminase subunit PdxT [Candidatus Krumholzibacteria bacterium]HRY40846.1 pyridoxal 5'-phosphate synthase glutaminase subunit PdxT [Candidatus Krumholzibacteria bacterium]
MTLPIGLLALQGDFELHRRALASLGRATMPVRRPAELAAVSGLVIPGGESTTLSRLIDRAGLRVPLADFAAGGRPILGTCAGLIMLSSGLDGETRPDWHGVQPLGLLDVRVQRNGFGRQVDSFTEDLDLDGLAAPGARFAAVYIRAPRITAVGPTAAVICRRPGGEVVGVRQGRVVGLTFHPELTDDGRFHALLT